MNATNRFQRGVLWAWPVLALAIGCACPNSFGPPADSITRKRLQRSEQAGRWFEARRDFAEFQAALAAWNHRDVQGCKERLQRLLKRNPNHRDARLLMADVYLAGNRPHAALRQVQQVLKVYPKDPQVQYALGLVLNEPVQLRKGVRNLLPERPEGRVAQEVPDRFSRLSYHKWAAIWEPDQKPYAAGYHVAWGAVIRAEACSTGSIGRPSGSSPNPPGLAVVFPDPTARPAGPAPSPAAWRPKGPATAAAVCRRQIADHVAHRSTAVRHVSHTETELLPSSPAWRPKGPATAASADHSPRVPTTPRRVSRADTAGCSDPADSAEVADTDPVPVSVHKGGAAPAESPRELPPTHLRKAAAIRPNNPQIPISMAIAALRYGQPDLAIELLRPTEQASSGSARVYRILAVAYYRLGDYQSSQVALQQALSLDKSSALSYFLMGCTLAKLGQFESAEAHLRQARTIDPRYTFRR